MVKINLKKVWEKIFDKLGLIVFVALIMIILIAMFEGVTYKLTENFLEFIIEISFILAGISFFALSSKINKYTFWMAQSCWAFILSGFFILAYILIPKLGSPEAPTTGILGFVSAYSPIVFFIGFVCFLVGMAILVVALYIKIDLLQLEKNKKGEIFQVL